MWETLLPQLHRLCAAALGLCIASQSEVNVFLIRGLRDSSAASAASAARSCTKLHWLRNFYHMQRSSYIHLIWYKRHLYCISCPSCVKWSPLLWLCAAVCAGYLPPHTEICLPILCNLKSYWLFLRDCRVQLSFKNGVFRTVTSWWRHQLETFSALLVICAGNWPVTGEFPEQRPVTRSFDIFFDLHPNKQLGQQSRGWWFETPSRQL